MARDIPVFISYARADEHFATELLDRLKQEPDIAPWQDRIRMAPGDFEEQLKQGIESAEYFVLVMTPGALRSPWVEKEWRHARENGVCICPIQPTFDSPSARTELAELRAKLPLWMQKIQTYDFEAYWKRFVAVLQSPCQATRTPFMATRLTANFIARPTLSASILDCALDAGHKNPSGKRVVLLGSGGFGKTTLASSVCQEEDVFTACDGGILWATLGAEPSVLELEKLYAALTGKRPGFKDQDDAMLELGKALDGKRCLIVIDDVWDFQDLKPFLHGGEQSTRLITTRRFNVAVQTADESCRITVGAVQPAEAESMLAAGLSAPPADLAPFRRLAARLGEWPLLLKLANGALLEQVALGQNIAGALDWANEIYEQMGVVAFDQENPKARQQAIGKTVELSLSFLNGDRNRGLALGIFAEEAEIPLSLAGIVWSTDDTSTQRLAQRIHDLGLADLNLPGRYLQIHDTLRAYYRGQLAAPELLHAKLADLWKDSRRIAGGYAVQNVAYHLVEAMSDLGQAIARGQQLVDLLTNSRYREYHEQHGDAAALGRQITLGIQRAAISGEKEAPTLVASLAVLRRSYAERERDPGSIFIAAAEGRISEAEQRLELFEPEPHWRTLARLLIAWTAPANRGEESRSLVDSVAPVCERPESSMMLRCDRPELIKLIEWVRRGPTGVPTGLQPIQGGPDLRYILAIMQRAGAAPGEGLEPLDYGLMVSGKDTSGFIAERDGPDLVAFAKLDPVPNTQYLERYIDIHAANRYVHYRNRSLWALLAPVLEFPDAAWVRTIVHKILTAALSAASVEFEEFLPLAVKALQARAGDQAAIAALESAKQSLFAEAARLQQEAESDSWSHYQRRACALAEIYTLALDRPADTVALLQLARDLPKGFAGFRAFSALMLAESARIAVSGDVARIDAALESAQAASHRIQDYTFCLRATAMVNAMRLQSWNNAGMNIEDAINRFVSNSSPEDFCMVHRVLENFEFRTRDHAFQALPIPPEVLRAQTLRQIAVAYGRSADELQAVNQSIWGGIDQVLSKDEKVNVPEMDFTPLLAARLAAEALAVPELTDERRSVLLQRLVPLALPSRTALDTILARMLLSGRARAMTLPKLLAELESPGAQGPATVSEAVVA